MIIYKDLKFKYFNSLKINNLIKYFFEVESANEIYILKYIFDELSLSYFILGNCSKVMFIKEVVNEPVIYINEKFSELYIKNDKIIVSSGVKLNNLIPFLAKNNYSFLENLYPIPATIGGAIANNAGDYISSISDSLIEILVLTKNGKVLVIKNKDCDFSYRYFKYKNEYIILYAAFKIVQCKKEQIFNNISESLKYRINNQPVNVNTCGSLFKNQNNIKVYKLLNDLQLDSLNFNGARLSKKHKNFLITDEKTTPNDVLKLIDFIKKEVNKHYNVDLDLELTLY